MPLAGRALRLAAPGGVAWSLEARALAAGAALSLSQGASSERERNE